MTESAPQTLTSATVEVTWTLLVNTEPRQRDVTLTYLIRVTKYVGISWNETRDVLNVVPVFIAPKVKVKRFPPAHLAFSGFVMQTPAEGTNRAASRSEVLV